MKKYKVKIVSEIIREKEIETEAESSDEAGFKVLTKMKKELGDSVKIADITELKN